MLLSLQTLSSPTKHLQASSPGRQQTPPTRSAPVQSARLASGLLPGSDMQTRWASTSGTLRRGSDERDLSPIRQDLRGNCTSKALMVSSLNKSADATSDDANEDLAKWLLQRKRTLLKLQEHHEQQQQKQKQDLSSPQLFVQQLQTPQQQRFQPSQASQQSSRQLLLSLEADMVNSKCNLEQPPPQIEQLQSLLIQQLRTPPQAKHLPLTRPPSQQDSCLADSVHNHPLAQPASELSTRRSLMGNCHIMAPSMGPSNDAMRIRNAGRRTGAIRPLVPRMLHSSESEPILGQTCKPAWEAANSSEAAKSLPTSPLGIEMKTPRTLRGVVRKQSKVNLGLPVHRLRSDARPAEPPKRIKSRSQTPEHRKREDRSTSPAQKNPSNAKKVTFSDDLLEQSIHEWSTFFSLPGKSTRSEADLRESGRMRSIALMASLYDLRRSGKDDQASRPSSPSPGQTEAGTPDAGIAGGDSQVASVEEPDTLLNATLKDVDDDEAMLRKLEATMADAHEPVGLLGGSRHATAVVSSRTLAVVRRKAHLLQLVEARIHDFQEAHDRRADHMKEIIEAVELDPRLVGVKEFLAAHIHKKGEPVDEDKSSFQVFVASFGLPSKHKAALKLRSLVNEAAEFWADAALQQALAGAEAAVIRRLMDCVAIISGNPNHPALANVAGILGDCLAKKVLEAAKRYWARDEATVARSPAPQPESAKKTADLIFGEIQGAVANGAPPKHPCLSEAKVMETEMREAEKDRHAERVCRYAEDLREKDDAEAAKAIGVPPVGPASDKADLIEKEVQRTFAEYGVEESHSWMAKAIDIGKRLRDRDGERKRMANREKRLADKNQTYQQS
eukprot:TRINITY_DN89673_c0_g1_i1.p1 TRINITY_DN89673_c0_g1~~TRINITY_DN89673_c0_g1_i1.p1  ORF type:complete len:842 (-),score=144.55 TRINITY_DN89673_c0_g1_i1:28-2553(-)